MSVLHSFAAGEDDPNAEAPSVRVLSADAINTAKLGLGTAFVGGSCCVHFSIEYTPTGTADGMVGVAVHDSNDTQLLWVKKVAAGLGYQIKECIVTTKPGAPSARTCSYRRAGTCSKFAVWSKYTPARSRP